MSLKTLLTVLALACTFASFANTEMTARQSYIQKYKHLAVEQMHLTNIPASIILAQAVIESGNGESRLAIASNNHFGIKCKNYWEGKTFYFEDDDYDNEGNLTESCFRAYEDAEDSFRNHGEFLTTTPWYAELFTYGNDYEKWAYGLKRIGYASCPNYAEKLISVIESNELYKLDKEPAPVFVEDLPKTIKAQNEEIDPAPKKPVFKFNQKTNSVVRNTQKIETPVTKVNSSPYSLISPVTREEVKAKELNEAIACSSTFKTLTQRPFFRRFEMR